MGKHMDTDTNLSGVNTALDQIAEELAASIPDPRAWRSTVLYLVENLQRRAGDAYAFESMLANLCDDLACRIENGEW